MKVDYIIVGCGLAGIGFCEELRKNGRSFIVFDDIQDLTPLNSIKTVSGFFDINFLDGLTSLSGLGMT